MDCRGYAVSATPAQLSSATVAATSSSSKDNSSRWVMVVLSLAVPAGEGVQKNQAKPLSSHCPEQLTPAGCSFYLRFVLLVPSRQLAEPVALSATSPVKSAVQMMTSSSSRQT
jgi:hypothetical protein